MCLFACEDSKESKNNKDDKDNKSNKATCRKIFKSFCRRRAEIVDDKSNYSRTDQNVRPICHSTSSVYFLVFARLDLRVFLVFLDFLRLPPSSAILAVYVTTFCARIGARVAGFCFSPCALVGRELKVLRL